MAVLYKTSQQQTQCQTLYFFNEIVECLPSVLGNDYFNNEDDYGCDEVDAHETIIPVDKIEQYILSENSYTR